MCDLGALARLQWVEAGTGLPEGVKKVRHKVEFYVILFVAVFAFAGVTALKLMDAPRGVDVTPVPPIQPAPVVTQPSLDDPAPWITQMRPYCNPVDVETRMRWQPAPESPEGQMQRAACYAVAGRVDRARTVIEALPQARRHQAAGVVFDAVHPAADGGDEVAAGPMMELVVEFWPNHYMALYHAGAAAFERGEHAKAGPYLEEFLKQYSAEDGWRTSALSMLERIGRD
jgi:hypothetical protein